MKHIGFIGLGIMGAPMAQNLIRAGYPLTVFDIDQNRIQGAVDAGAKEAASIAETVTDADLVITMLPNSPHVLEVALGPEGIRDSARSGLIYVDMSSIAPGAAQQVARELEPKGVTMFDAPVSGGEPKAVDGTLAIMVGGPEDRFAEVKPVLEVMGSSATLIGNVGSGNTTKLANQIIVGMNIAALSEAMVLAKKAGVDPNRVFEAIRGGLAGSTVMDAKTPLITKRNFKPGFRIELHLKDLRNAMETAQQTHTPLPFSSQLTEILQSMVLDGHGGDDHGGIVQFFEELAKTEVK